jgi:hypothetical protein
MIEQQRPPRYFIDENIDNSIVKALGMTGTDFVRCQDTEMFEADDPEILAYTAERNLVVVTHDQATMPAFFWKHISAGKDHPGLIIIPAKYRKGIQGIVAYLVNLRSQDLRNSVWWYKPE